MTPKDFRDVRTPGNQSGASDLATFGASPAAFAIFAPATFGDTASAASPVAFRLNEAGTADRDTGALPAVESFAQQAAGLAGGTALPTASPDSAVPAAVPIGDAPATESAQPPAESAGVATFVPAPQGSGAASQPHQAVAPITAEVVAPASAPPAATVADVSPAAVSLDTVMTSVAALHEAVVALAGTLPGAAMAAIGPAIDHVTDTVGQAQAAVAATLTDLSHTVAHLTDGVTTAVDTVVAPAIADTLGTVTATIAAVPALAAPVTETAGTIIDTLTDGLVGSDPVAGITTLVGMVSAADAFDLHDVGNGASDLLAPALGSLGAADLLADIVPANVLLGLADHHDSGALSALHLDDGLHGLGL